MLTTNATNLPRLMNCNGSRNMPPSFPTIDIDPTARDEGNAAHWLAQQWFNQSIDPDLAVGQKAYNSVVITSEMIEHVSEYLKAINTGRMEVETSFGTDNWRVNARADHIHWQPEFVPTLTVDDFKYGWRLVEPFENWTLIAHAIGYCIFHQLVPDIIVLRIHQPRPHHPDGKLREWRLTYAELMQYYARINDTLTNPSDTLTTGLSWCAKCHALATCPAARSASMNAIDAASITFNDELPNDVIAYELDTLNTAESMITARRKALEELAAYRIRNGKVIDGYGVENQYANTRWKTGITPQALSMASKIDCIKPGIITPAEFKRRGGSTSVYDALTERPLTGTKLVRASADKRARRLLGK